MNEEEILRKIQEQIAELELRTNNSCNNGISFEKGKWIKIDDCEPPNDVTVFELLELKGNDVITNLWTRSYNNYEHKYEVTCLKDFPLTAKVLPDATEVDRPDWAKEK